MTTPNQSLQPPRPSGLPALSGRPAPPALSGRRPALPVPTFRPKSRSVTRRAISVTQRVGAAGSRAIRRLAVPSPPPAKTPARVTPDNAPYWTWDAPVTPKAKNQKRDKPRASTSGASEIAPPFIVQHGGPEPLRRSISGANPASVSILRRASNLPEPRYDDGITSLMQARGDPRPETGMDRIMQTEPPPLPAFNGSGPPPPDRLPDGLAYFVEDSRAKRALGIGSAPHQIESLSMPAELASGLNPQNNQTALAEGENIRTRLRHQNNRHPQNIPASIRIHRRVPGNAVAVPQPPGLTPQKTVRPKLPVPAPRKPTIKNQPPKEEQPPSGNKPPTEESKKDSPSGMGMGVLASAQLAQIKSKNQQKHKEFNIHINVEAPRGPAVAAMPANLEPEKATPKLAMWAKSMKADTSEGILKSFLVDAASNCAGCPSEFKDMTAGQAVSATMQGLNGSNTSLRNYAAKYGIRENKLGIDSRLRLREDGELEIISVKQPHEAPLGMVKARSPRPDEADYPQNAALREIITSDIWRQLTRSEKESAVAAINDELAGRRQKIDLLARVEMGTKNDQATATGCFCTQPGCSHNRVLQSVATQGATGEPASAVPQQLMDSLPDQKENPLDFIQVREETDYASPRSPAEERRAKAKVKAANAMPIRPKVAGIAKRVKKPSGPWFGPRK